MATVVNCFQFFNFKDNSQEELARIEGITVVNCFQFFNFKDNSQDIFGLSLAVVSCELLSVL